jgi:DNA-binding Xre family transcriptional regulator
MSQRELARRTDKHPDVISRFAREATEMVSYDLLDCICHALDCGVADLLEHVSDPDEQIGLFESATEAGAQTVYSRQQALLKAAENPPSYASGDSLPGGAA